MTEEQLKKEIFTRYGSITRARGCFLYTKKGVRLTDLYQAGGRAILGWGGGDAFTKLKNVLNRGLTGSFVTEFSPQVNKAVNSLLEFCPSDRKIFFTNSCPSGACVWEPWNTDNVAITELKNTDVFFLKPPLPWTNTLWICCVKSGVSDNNLSASAIDLPAPLEAAVARSLYDLSAALKMRQEKDWFIYDQILSPYFLRKGPYLYPKMAESEYDNFVLSCLDSGIIINPCYKEHSVVPYGADKGVFTKLKNLNK